MHEFVLPLSMKKLANLTALNDFILSIGHSTKYRRIVKLANIYNLHQYDSQYKAFYTDREEGWGSF